MGGIIFLPSIKGTSGSNAEITEINGPEEIRVKRPFNSQLPLKQLTGRDDIDDRGEFQNKEVKGIKDGYKGTKFKIAPHIDQSKVYQAVFDRLKNGGCVGIFPEGGSHDRSDLLPLKAGVAIMALGTLAEAPNCGLKIVPVGMNYFHPHKFRSRAVLEFGAPFEVPKELVEMYGMRDKRRAAIGKLLDMVHQSLSAVTVSAPDYDTLMVIQAARRLYNPAGKKLPLPIVVELNRRLALGYDKYKDDPRIVELQKSVAEYNKQLRYLNIRDHQVQYAKLSWPKVVVTFFYRVAKLLLLSAGVLPGLILFAPVFIATKRISHQKAKEALAGSTVKIQGKDVIATWKMLVSLAVAPVLYNLYTCILAYLVGKHRLWGYVPEWVPIWAVYFFGWVFFPAITFAALRFGEVGMDIVKSLRPLALCINPTSSYSLQSLKQRREELSAQVTHLINTLGPEMFPDFEQIRLVAADGSTRVHADGTVSPTQPLKRRDSGVSSPVISTPGLSTPGTESPHGIRRTGTTSSSRNIPRNESFSNIGQVPMFATRPPSRSRSRSSSAGGGGGNVQFGGPLSGFPVDRFPNLNSEEGFNEASKKIREAMRERGEMRRRKSQAKVYTLSDQSVDEEVEDETSTGSSMDEDGKKHL